MLKAVTLYTMGALYVAAGFFHFLKPKAYLKIMPPYIPVPLLMVYLSGAAEVALGIALLIPALQSYAAWGIILLLITVFPANFYMYQKGGAAFKMSDRALFWRMPLQLALIIWAYWYTK
jgi:uncharacterized membrane protein